MAGTKTSALPSDETVTTLLGLNTVDGSPQTRKIAIEKVAAQIETLRGPKYATRAELYADLAWASGSEGRVYGDATTAYIGVYKKTGVAGSGSWTRIGDLPEGDVAALEAYADISVAAARGLTHVLTIGGTANAITATSDRGNWTNVVGRMVRFAATATNTSTSVTIAVDGQTALAIKTLTGGNPPVGGIVAGQVYQGIVSAGPVMTVAQIMAPDADAIAGTRRDLVMTPAGAKAALDSRVNPIEAAGYSDFATSYLIQAAPNATRTSTGYNVYTPGSPRALDSLIAVVVLDLGSEPMSSVGSLFLQGQRDSDGGYTILANLTKIIGRATGTVICRCAVAANATVYRNLSIACGPIAGKTITVKEVYLVEGDNQIPQPHELRRAAAIEVAKEVVRAELAAGLNRDPATDNVLAASNRAGSVTAGTLQLIAPIAKTVASFSCSVRLSVTGASYPSASTDSSVFTSPEQGLRCEIFNASSSLPTYLKRAGDTDIWYLTDVPVTLPGPHTSIKIVAGAHTGVTIGFAEARIVLDAGPTTRFASDLSASVAAEAAARDTAIANATAAMTSNLSAVLSSIINPPETAYDVVALSASRRIALCGCGDSNQLKDGTGWDDGFIYGLGLKFSQFASGIAPMSGPVTYTDGIGSGNGSVTPSGSAGSGAPSGLDAYELPVAEFPYLYQSSGDMGHVGWSVSPPQGGGWLHSDLHLKFYMAYGTFPSGGGSFTPGVRYDAPPWSTILVGSTVSTDGPYGAALATLELPAATRGITVGFKWRVPGGTASVGPTIELWQAVEAPDRITGFQWCPFYAESGQSMYDLAAYVIGLPNAQLDNWLKAVRTFQTSKGQPPIMMYVISMGLNDRNETSVPSLGPGAFSTGNSSDAYVDNWKAFINRIEERFVANHWPLSGCWFWLIGSHPVSEPDDAQLVSYRTAAAAFAATRERTTVTDMHSVVSSTELASYYLSGGSDRNHMNQAGYRFAAQRILGLVPATS